MGLEPWVLLLEGLFISLGAYTRNPSYGDIHHTILLVGLQHCCTKSLASSYIIAIIVDTTFLSLTTMLFLLFTMVQSVVLQM